MGDTLITTLWPLEGKPLAPGICPPGFRPLTDRVLEEIVRRIVRAVQPQKIVLFGSYAYGQPTEDSDLDLLVVLETDAPVVQRYLAVSRLLRPRPIPLDILVRTPQEIEEALEKGDGFIREILEWGKILYERE
jgi:predicted nucleotidyltransferase